MGLFDELDVAGAADDPWSIPDNVYPGVVSDLKVKANDKGNWGMYFKFKITSGEYAKREISEYKRLPHPQDATPLDPAKKANALSYIKARLASLGIPEERMNGVSKEDLIGIECFISTKMNGNFVNVRDITLDATDLDVDTIPTGTAQTNPFLT